MNAKDQIEVLRNIEDINKHNENNRVDTLKTPVTSLPDIKENIRVIKYKLSVIENILNNPSI